LKPDAIPLQVKVVLIGDLLTYLLLFRGTMEWGASDPKAPT
jgi:hypothetical protein